MDSEKLQAGPRDGEGLTGCDTMDVEFHGFSHADLGVLKRQLLSMLAQINKVEARMVRGYKLRPPRECNERG